MENRSKTYSDTSNLTFSYENGSKWFCFDLAFIFFNLKMKTDKFYIQVSYQDYTQIKNVNKNNFQKTLHFQETNMHFNYVQTEEFKLFHI